MRMAIEATMILSPSSLVRVIHYAWMIGFCIEWSINVSISVIHNTTLGPQITSFSSHIAIVAFPFVRSIGYSLAHSEEGDTNLKK